MRYLRESFDRGNLHYECIDKEKDYWYIYSIFNKKENTENYIVFKFKKTNNEIEYQCFPAPGYERVNDWYYECNNNNDCYTWLEEKKLISNSI